MFFCGPVVCPSSMWDARLVKVKTVIEYCIVHAHSLTSADNTTVDRTVQDQNVCVSLMSCPLCISVARKI
jgi:hypothetical protein